MHICKGVYLLGVKGKNRMIAIIPDMYIAAVVTGSGAMYARKT
jgi:hypothetical protein